VMVATLLGTGLEWGKKERDLLWQTPTEQVSGAKRDGHGVRRPSKSPLRKGTGRDFVNRERLSTRENF